MASGRNRSQFNQTFIPQYTYTGVGKNRKAVPMNAAAISEMISNNPELNPGGGILSNSESQNTGIISNANAGSTNTNPVVTPTTTNNEDKEPQNIFGERIAQALFPGISQDNKQLINAAILRGSLELLKPRQPGENLASQLGRGLQAGTQLGADIQKRQLEALATQAALLKAQQTGKQVSVTKEKKEIFENVIDPLFAADQEFRTDIETLKKQTNDIMDLNPETRRALELEAMTINARRNLGAVASMKLAVKNFLSGNLVSKETDSTEDRFAGRTIKEKK
tara:strand:+ start:742 stop:1581 length:840 start_codon:yes stop_codon:yes gene_type:complete